MDIDVNYISGRDPIRGVLRIDDTGVGMLFGKKRSGGYPWDQIRRISFDDPGRTKANGAAIAMFGVLGMAARRSFTYITVSVLDTDLHFENQSPLADWRSWAARLAEDIPYSVGRIFVDGQPVGAPGPQAASAIVPALTPTQQLRELADLRDAGIVTPAEFEAKKAELLSRM